MNENERKYILNPNNTSEYWSYLKSREGATCRNIEQGYIVDSVIVTFGSDISSNAGNLHYIKEIDGVVIHINIPITSWDLEMLISNADKNPHHTSRYQRVNSNDSFYPKGIIRVRTSVDSTARLNYFTFKSRISGCTVELEVEIDYATYAGLIIFNSSYIQKTRITIPSTDYTWEIDLFNGEFSHNTATPLLIAEVEMPADEIEPRHIPEYIMLANPYLVDIMDRTFDNATMAQPR